MDTIFSLPLFILLIFTVFSWKYLWQRHYLEVESWQELLTALCPISFSRTRIQIKAILKTVNPFSVGKFLAKESLVIGSTVK